MEINEAWILVKMSSVKGNMGDSEMYQARQVVQKFIDRYKELDVEVEAESKVVETTKSKMFPIRGRFEDLVNKTA